MRHNQNARRMRGGRNGGHNNGGGSHHNNGQNRRVNPRVHTFDSNGPDVRIRGTAYQINEKYTALARDAASAGDRILAESYLQHAEHYQRFINEATEEFNQFQQQQQQHQQQQPGYQPQQPQAEAQQPAPAAEQPPSDGLSDLDQGFLVGPRGGAPAPVNAGAGEQPAAEAGQQNRQPRPRHVAGRRGGEEA